MLVHSFVPDGFGKNVVVPVIKNRSASFNDVNNYKPLSIEPILLHYLSSV
jgi:hypothetical protein